MCTIAVVATRAIGRERTTAIANSVTIPLAGSSTAESERRETGLDYFGTKYFSSTQGMFNSPDPALDSAKLDDPQTWNRYAYVSNNPLRYVDPDGREHMRHTKIRL